MARERLCEALGATKSNGSAEQYTARTGNGKV